MNIQNQRKLDPRTERMVNDFSETMKRRLLEVQDKYGNNWQDTDWEEEAKEKALVSLLQGDLVDAANYIAFMNFHGWSSSETLSRLAPRIPSISMIDQGLKKFNSWLQENSFEIELENSDESVQMQILRTTEILKNAVICIYKGCINSSTAINNDFFFKPKFITPQMKTEGVNELNAWMNRNGLEFNIGEAHSKEENQNALEDIVTEIYNACLDQYIP